MGLRGINGSYICSIATTIHLDIQISRYSFLVGRLILGTAHIFKKNPYWGKALSLVALVLGAASLLLKNAEFVYLYPVLVNSVLFVVFIYSLFGQQTIIEKIARLKEAQFTDRQIPYVRKVTIAWAIFFLLNGFVALLTVFIEDKIYWSLYNGGISYALMGLMFASELYYRKRCIKHA